MFGLGIDKLSINKKKKRQFSRSFVMKVPQFVIFVEHLTVRYF